MVSANVTLKSLYTVIGIPSLFTAILGMYSSVPLCNHFTIYCIEYAKSETASGLVKNLKFIMKYVARQRLIFILPLQ